MQSGEILWTGHIDFGHDEDALKSIDIPSLPVGSEDRCFLSARNGSPTVDVTVFVGYLRKVSPVDDLTKVWSASGVVATDVITSVAHGLKAGDAIEIVDAGGGTGVAGTVYYVVGPSNTAAHSTPVTADTFSLALSRGSDTVLNITSTGLFTFKLASEFVKHTSFSLAKWAAASSVVPVAGLESKIVDAWPFATHGGRLLVAKSAATAGIFSVDFEIRRG